MSEFWRYYAAAAMVTALLQAMTIEREEMTRADVLGVLLAFVAWPLWWFLFLLWLLLSVLSSGE